MIERSNHRVVLADDHAMFRQGLAAILKKQGINVIGEAENGYEAVELIRQIEPAPDVALFDLSMPVMNGLEASSELAEYDPNIPIILLTMHTEKTYVLQALRVGISGYVLKSQAVSDIIDAIRQVTSGSIYLSPGISETVVNATKNVSETSHNYLTHREQQVLKLISNGKTTKEIAGLLGTSKKTVESHRARIKNKLDIHETANLVRYAIRNGFIDA